MTTLKNDVIILRCLFNMVTAFKTVYSLKQCSKHTKHAFCIGRFLLSFFANFQSLVKKGFVSIQTYSVTNLL